MEGGEDREGWLERAGPLAEGTTGLLLAVR